MLTKGKQPSGFARTACMARDGQLELECSWDTVETSSTFLNLWTQVLASAVPVTVSSGSSHAALITHFNIWGTFARQQTIK